MNILLWHWCWDRLQPLTGHNVVFVFFRLLLNIHFSSPVTIWYKKPFLCFLWISCSQVKNPLLVSVHKALNCLDCESFVWISIVRKLLMFLLAVLAYGTDHHRVMAPIPHLQIFLVVQNEACLQRWSRHSRDIKTISYMNYQLEYCHHKLLRTFDAIQPHFLEITAEN